MKSALRVGFVSPAVSLLFGISAVAYAQHEQEAKPAQATQEQKQARPAYNRGAPGDGIATSVVL